MNLIYMIYVILPIPDFARFQLDGRERDLVERQQLFRAFRSRQVADLQLPDCKRASS
jgi:hypothetical protein